MSLMVIKTDIYKFTEGYKVAKYMKLSQSNLTLKEMILIHVTGDTPPSSPTSKVNPGYDNIPNSEPPSSYPNSPTHDSKDPKWPLLNPLNQTDTSPVKNHFIVGDDSDALLAPDSPQRPALGATHPSQHQRGYLNSEVALIHQDSNTPLILQDSEDVDNVSITIGSTSETTTL